MAVFYILGALILIIMNIGNFPEALRQIFVGAFNPGAALGGFTGVAVSSAIQYGVARACSPTKLVWVLPHMRMR